MRQKQKKLIIAGIIGLFVLAILFSSGVLKLPTLAVGVPSDLEQYVGKCSGGFTTLSTSDVNIVTQGDRIRVFGVVKGSECLKIEFKQSDLDAKLKSQGFDATRDVIGNIRLLEYTKSFPISQNGNFKGNFNNQIASGTSLNLATLQNCQNKGINAIDVYRPFPFADLRCVTEGQQGFAGDFVGTSYGNFKVQFDFDGSSTIISGRPTSEEEVQQSASLRNGDIKIEWVGLLGNLDDVSIPSSYDARLINSKWNLIQSGAMNEINGRIRQNFLSCVGYGISDGQFDSCKSTFNSESSKFLQNKLSSYQSSVSNLVFDSSTDSNALYVSLKAPPFPAFIIDLNAESVGIISLEGNPKITQCITAQNLDSGKNKVVSYSVKNDANVNNVEFLSNIICSSGVSPYSTSFNIGANEQKTLTAELIPSNPNQQVLTSSCTLTIKDLKSGNSDSCSFNNQINYVSGIVCSANTLSCDDLGKNVVQCSSDGKTKSLKTECAFGCVVDSSSGGARCIGQDDLDKNRTGGFFDKIKDFFNNLFGGVFDFFKILKIGFSLVALTFSSLFLKDLISSFRALKRKSGIAWTISLALGLIIGYLVYLSFWFLILVGIIVVLKVVMGR